MSRALGGVVIDRGEKLVPSPWFKRWRQRLWETLPKGLSPVSWKDPNLMNLCGAIWSEIAEHTSRTGDKTVKEALLFFRDAESEATRWLFVPGADILLIIGDGLLTLTALGIFITQEYVDPVAPPTMSTLAACLIRVAKDGTFYIKTGSLNPFNCPSREVNIVIPTFASVNPPVQAVAANVPQMPPLSYSARPELNRMQCLVMICRFPCLHSQIRGDIISVLQQRYQGLGEKTLFPKQRVNSKGLPHAE